MSATNAPLYDVKTLLQQVAEGDERAFRQIFDKYKEPFFAAAYKITRSSDLSEDIVQQVFVTLWTKKEQVAAAIKPENYLFTILHNHIYSHYRKLAMEKQMIRAVSKGVEAADDNHVEEILFAKENQQLMEAVISKLPPQQQLVYRLWKEGEGREEIAARLQISPNTVKNHLQDAKLFIRNYFKQNISELIWMAIWYSL